MTQGNICRGIVLFCNFWLEFNGFQSEKVQCVETNTMLKISIKRYMDLYDFSDFSGGLVFWKTLSCGPVSGTSHISGLIELHFYYLPTVKLCVFLSFARFLIN